MNWLFGDWIPVWSHIGEWSRDGYIVKRATYEIQYSSDKQMYRLKCSGHHPKRHPTYPYVIKTLASYLEALNEKKFT